MFDPCNKFMFGNTLPYQINDIKYKSCSKDDRLQYCMSFWDQKTQTNTDIGIKYTWCNKITDMFLIRNNSVAY